MILKIEQFPVAKRFSPYEKFPKVIASTGKRRTF
jgi:hypothetical protein